MQNSIDWFISLSSSEGLPISICEALSYGVPVIATDVGGVSEVVTSDVGILLYEPITEDIFVNSMERYINDKAAYCNLRKNAFVRWEHFFNAKKLRSEFVEKIV